MDKNKVIVRELLALGQYWRNDWSEFDGITLRDQMNYITSWFTANNDEDFTVFTDLLSKQIKELEDYCK